MLHSLAKIPLAEFKNDTFSQDQVRRYIDALIRSARVITSCMMRDWKEVIRDTHLFRDIASHQVIPLEFAQKADRLLAEWQTQKGFIPSSMYEDIDKFIKTFERYVEYIEAYIS
jgi:uncharacterized protein YutE (UPF0331/DUF86 family)